MQLADRCACTRSGTRKQMHPRVTARDPSPIVGERCNASWRALDEAVSRSERSDRSRVAARRCLQKDIARDSRQYSTKSAPGSLAIISISGLDNVVVMFDAHLVSRRCSKRRIQRQRSEIGRVSVAAPNSHGAICLFVDRQRSGALGFPFGGIVCVLYHQVNCSLSERSTERRSASWQSARIYKA